MLWDPVAQVQLVQGPAGASWGVGPRVLIRDRLLRQGPGQVLGYIGKGSCFLPLEFLSLSTTDILDQMIICCQEPA